MPTVPRSARRTSAMFTRGIQTRTVLYLLRLRSQIRVERRGAEGRYVTIEVAPCRGVYRNRRPQRRRARVVDRRRRTVAALAHARSGTWPTARKSQLIEQTFDALHSVWSLSSTVSRISGHGNCWRTTAAFVRPATPRAFRYDVTPALPVDKIGIYVFVPMASL